MCGIAGIIQTTPEQYNIEQLKKITSAIAHRGPDGECFWENETGQVLFGHRRLSILDLSGAAAQPFHYMDRYTIIHNGEIYNYVELRDQLKNLGYQFRTAGDTEVLVAAYDRWKEKCLEHFDGMFAFAIWDQKENEFFAARDRFGEKPFFFYYDAGKNAFLFASELKGLWSVLEKSPNLQMLFNFLTIGYVDNPNDPPETFDNNIDKLPPAHYLKISLQSSCEPTIEKYWDLVLDKELKINEDDAKQQFLELLQGSVKRRLRSDVPLGTSLSGGLDSSSIVSIISGITSNKLKTFSAIFPGFEKNEEKYIDDVTSHYALESFKTSLTPGEIPSILEKMIKQQDEPFGSAGLLPQYKVFQLAKENNVKVLLDGQGADETLGGYHKYYKWYWQELFRKGRLVRSGEIKKAREIGVKEDFNIKNVIAALVPDFASVFLERQYLLHALQHEDLTREFVQLQSKEAYYSTPTIFSLNGALYFNTCMHGLEELLRYADRNSMAHGREVRLPFLDHHLVEFLFSLPSGFKIQDGWTKWLLRKTMDKQLPQSITWRKDKVGLEPPQYQWMQQDAVIDMIQQSKKKLVKEKILKPEVLNKKIQPSTAYEKDSYDWRYLTSAALL